MNYKKEHKKRKHKLTHAKGLYLLVKHRLEVRILPFKITKDKVLQNL